MKNIAEQNDIDKVRFLCLLDYFKTFDFISRPLLISKLQYYSRVCHYFDAKNIYLSGIWWPTWWYSWTAMYILLISSNSNNLSRDSAVLTIFSVVVFFFLSKEANPIILKIKDSVKLIPDWSNDALKLRNEMYKSYITVPIEVYSEFRFCASNIWHSLEETGSGTLETESTVEFKWVFI